VTSFTVNNLNDIFLSGVNVYEIMKLLKLTQLAQSLNQKKIIKILSNIRLKAQR